jgi:hypothetical protein
MSGFGEFQEHGECERCGDASPTNSNVTIGFGLPAVLCHRCSREFTLYSATTAEVKAWEKDRAIRATFKLMMQNPKEFGVADAGGVTDLCKSYKEAMIAYERAMADVNVMAMKFLANKIP